jgi:hypothetical protein
VRRPAEPLLRPAKPVRLQSSEQQRMARRTVYRRRELEAQAPLKEFRLRDRVPVALALRFGRVFRLLAAFARARHR